MFVNLGNMYLVLKRFLRKVNFHKIIRYPVGPPGYIRYPVGAQDLPPPHEMSPPRILTSGIRYPGGGPDNPGIRYPISGGGDRFLTLVIYMYELVQYSRIDPKVTIPTPPVRCQAQCLTSTCTSGVGSVHPDPLADRQNWISVDPHTHGYTRVDTEVTSVCT